jgi:excisionase family DNA binding protein
MRRRALRLLWRASRPVDHEPTRQEEALLRLTYAEQLQRAAADAGAAASTEAMLDRIRRAQDRIEAQEKAAEQADTGSAPTTDPRGEGAFGVRAGFLAASSPSGVQADVRVAESLLTVAEVAAMFKVDPKTVTRWAKAGKLTSIRTLGGHRRYRETEVRALLAGIPQKPSE